MSVWASVDGTIHLKDLHRKPSVRKSIQEHFDEVCIDSIVQSSLNSRVEFVFSFCADGMDAAEQVDKWIESIRECVKHADISVTVRWLVQEKQNERISHLP